MTIGQIEAIRDVVAYCICPLLLLLDFSYGTLNFKKVFEICDRWWYTLASLPIPKLVALLPEKVTAIFQAIYGQAHFSLKCVLRSFISSFCAMAFVFFFLNAVDLSGIGAKNSVVHIQDALLILSDRLSTSPAVIFLLVIGANFAIDYISLLETRFVLSRIGSASTLRTIFLTTVDYFFTTLLWVAGFYLLVIWGNQVGGAGAVPFVKVESFGDIVFFPIVFSTEYFRHGSIASGQGVPVGHLIGLFSFSTYFTSLLFYVFAVTSITLRLAGGLADRLAEALYCYSERRRPPPITLISILLFGAAQAVTALYKLILRFG